MAELQAQLEVEMAKHTNVTDGTLPLDKRNKNHIWTNNSERKVIGWNINRLRLLGLESCVMNNGHSTGYFPLERGTRQGDPLSAYLLPFV